MDCFAHFLNSENLEFLNWSSLCGLHLSRLAEDLIIYSSQEFRLVRISDEFCTGSSLMPQKRNPDGLELVRGAAGLLLGDAFSLGSVLKGLPSTYNKDLQTDKELLFRSHDRLLECIKVIIGTIATLEIDKARALSLLDANMLATDVAHELVRRGVPFRRAHHHVGRLVCRATELRCDLRTLPYEEYLSVCPEIGSEEELQSLFSWEASVEQYRCEGGTARAAVGRQLDALSAWLGTAEGGNRLEGQS
ncbi:Argininosuccinate lyase [Eumeta japonica]|uniref:Argininosuccinate lyase n=1 Tax=Eumeta variegata TaxID=151549 RepID=A0A4C1TBQ4_EUMVA|nr:Argininosuccinate lyase [Eumeta japonica]